MKIFRCILYVIFSILIFSCGENATEPDSHTQNPADFEAAWNRINDVYPFFEFKKIDWDSVYSEYHPQVEAAEGIEFHGILHNLLAGLRDAHVFYQLLYGGTIVPYYSPRQLRDKDSFSLPVVKTYFDQALLTTTQGTAEYRVLADSIGYIYLSNLENDDLADEFPIIIQYMIDTKGLILDMRHNHGGSIQNIEVIVTRFLT